MNDDAVRKLREPGAWALLGSAALQLIAGLIGLLAGSELPFTFRAFNLVYGDQFFTGVAVAGLVVVAVLLVTRVGGEPTPQARNIALIGAILLAAMAVIEALCVLAGLAVGSGSNGIVPDVSAGAKAAMFVSGIGKLAVLAAGGYYAFTVFQPLQPVRTGTGPFPQQSYGQPQPPYGGGYPQPQQPPYGPPAQQPYQPQQGYYQQPAQPYQQQAGQAQPSEGEWTVAYGSGGQQDAQDQEPGDRHRPPQ